MEYTAYMDTQVGILQITTDLKSLTSIKFVGEKYDHSTFQPEILKKTIEQLTEYFKGTRKKFELETAPEGTAFQKLVWNHVKNISYGEMASYLDIAIKTGSKKNTRAVGRANGLNPIPIIIPCHRIVGSNRKLTGYAGGLERKRWLLKHELNYSENRNRLF